jgi:hypothetical protein
VRASDALRPAPAPTMSAVSYVIGSIVSVTRISEDITATDDMRRIGGTCFITARYVSRLEGMLEELETSAMPFLLWVIYPYTIWMGCYSMMVDPDHRHD